MTDPQQSEPDEFPLSVLEDDENIPPRPEEELADEERSDPQES
jgi:hypothetical protein